MKRENRRDRSRQDLQVWYPWPKASTQELPDAEVNSGRNCDFAALSESVETARPMSWEADAEATRARMKGEKRVIL